VIFKYTNTNIGDYSSIALDAYGNKAETDIQTIVHILKKQIHGYYDLMLKTGTNKQVLKWNGEKYAE
jgi:hypothetical protein